MGISENAEAIEVDELRKKIRQFLQENGCEPRVSGYTVLKDILMLSVEHPNFNCKQLFMTYADEMGCKWHVPYKRASYCILASQSPYKGVWGFISAFVEGVNEA